MILPSLAWSVAENADLSFGFLLGLGERPEQVELTDLLGDDGLPLEGNALLRKMGVRGEFGLVPGSVPPFGRPILPFELYVDESVTQNDRIAFNAGSLTDSVIMATDDYLRLAKPTIFAFTKP